MPLVLFAVALSVGLDAAPVALAAHGGEGQERDLTHQLKPGGGGAYSGCGSGGTLVPVSAGVRYVVALSTEIPSGDLNYVEVYMPGDDGVRLTDLGNAALSGDAAVAQEIQHASARRGWLLTFTADADGNVYAACFGAAKLGTDLQARDGKPATAKNVFGYAGASTQGGSVHLVVAAVSGLAKGGELAVREGEISLSAPNRFAHASADRAIRVQTPVGYVGGVAAEHDNDGRVFLQGVSGQSAGKFVSEVTVHLWSQAQSCCGCATTFNVAVVPERDAAPQQTPFRVAVPLSAPGTSTDGEWFLTVNLLERTVSKSGFRANDWTLGTPTWYAYGASTAGDVVPPAMGASAAAPAYVKLWADSNSCWFKSKIQATGDAYAGGTLWVGGVEYPSNDLRGLTVRTYGAPVAYTIPATPQDVAAPFYVYLKQRRLYGFTALPASPPTIATDVGDGTGECGAPHGYREFGEKDDASLAYTVWECRLFYPPAAPWDAVAAWRFTVTVTDQSEPFLLYAVELVNQPSHPRVAERVVALDAAHGARTYQLWALDQEYTEVVLTLRDECDGHRPLAGAAMEISANNGTFAAHATDADGRVVLAPGREWASAWLEVVPVATGYARWTTHHKVPADGAYAADVLTCPEAPPEPEAPPPPATETPNLHPEERVTIAGNATRVVSHQLALTLERTTPKTYYVDVVRWDGQRWYSAAQRVLWDRAAPDSLHYNYPGRATTLADVGTYHVFAYDGEGRLAAGLTAYIKAAWGDDARAAPILTPGTAAPLVAASQQEPATANGQVVPASGGSAGVLPPGFDPDVAGQASLAGALVPLVVAIAFLGLAIRTFL